MKNPIKTLLASAVLAASVVTMTGCESDSDSNTNTVAYSASDAATYSEQELKAYKLIRSLETGATEPVAYINADQYTQHNLDVADGLAGFGAALGQLATYNEANGETTKADVKRVFEYGDYVVLHTEYNFFGPKAGFDIFRFENGLIVEHWDNLIDIAAPNASGHTQFDGATEITDLDKTEENIAIVNDFVDTILTSGTGDITTFIGPNEGDYIQHNPGVADDLSGLSEALKALADAGTPMVYTKRHITLGEGNFVLSVSEGTFLGENVAFYDMFRLKNGMIVEHWDTIQTIPAESEWKNSNGKFGFSN